MLDRAQSFGEAAKDIALVWTAQFGVIAVRLTMHLNEVLTTVSLGLTIAFTIWRWRKEARKGKP